MSVGDTNVRPFLLIICEVIAHKYRYTEKGDSINFSIWGSPSHTSAFIRRFHNNSHQVS